MSPLADFIFMSLSIACAAFCGFLAGREWRKKQFDATLKKETYEQGKLDGAFEFVQQSIFKNFKQR